MSHPGFPGAGAGCHDAALALVEVASIARGMRVGDAMVKRAACRVLLGEPVTPGKFLVLVSGPVDVVEESFQAGVAEAGEDQGGDVAHPEGRKTGTWKDASTAFTPTKGGASHRGRDGR